MTGVFLFCTATSTVCRHTFSKTFFNPLCLNYPQSVTAVVGLRVGRTRSCRYKGGKNVLRVQSLHVCRVGKTMSTGLFLISIVALILVVTEAGKFGTLIVWSLALKREEVSSQDSTPEMDRYKATAGATKIWRSRR